MGRECACPLQRDIGWYKDLWCNIDISFLKSWCLSQVSLQRKATSSTHSQLKKVKQNSPNPRGGNSAAKILITARIDSGNYILMSGRLQEENFFSCDFAGKKVHDVFRLCWWPLREMMGISNNFLTSWKALITREWTFKVRTLARRCCFFSMIQGKGMSSLGH